MPAGISWSQPGQRYSFTAAGPGTSRTTQSPSGHVSTVSGPAGNATETGGPGLPKRVRQASLVPELRNPPPAYPPLPGRFPDPRTPDEARATVSAIQHGWERGRSMFDPDPGQRSKSAAAGPGGPGESGTDHGEPGDCGAYQQGTPSDDRGPHGPG